MVDLKHPSALDRRRLLLAGGSAAVLPLSPAGMRGLARPRWADTPFTLGVASGDPDHQGVVIWTRLAPKPMQGDGGMPAEPVAVDFEVANDAGMKQVVRRGTVRAMPQLGHSVHVELDGLEADRWYHFRFRCGDAESPVGRTRTLPAPDTQPERLRFAVTSCQNYEQGLFTAYQQMARDDVDLVFHLGDYIYEYEAGRNGKVRTHHGKEIESLGDYRVRYAQYRLDRDLQAMHAVCPWLVTWDDHEVDNNYAKHISEQAGVSPRQLLARRANAYQAYYEMMPLRRSSLPRGPHLQLYRKASFGRLAELIVLDTRQYRSDQPNQDRRSPLNEAALNPRNTLLGSAQMNWLQQRLLGSEARWNVLAQQVMMALVHRWRKDGEKHYSMDQWPGYAAERARLLRFLQSRRVANPVVLTGDIHSNWANELRIDDRVPEQPLVATEFVATSLSSGGNGSAEPRGLERLMAENPAVRFHTRERGYIRCTVDQGSWLSEYMAIDDVLEPGGKTSVRAAFRLEAGSPKLHRV